MPDYREARAAIASIIGAVEISEPVSLQIAHVYETRQDQNALLDYPCVIITGYQLTYTRFPSGLRERTYNLGLRLAVRPQEISTATTEDMLTALKESISQAFDTKLGLGFVSGYVVLDGPNWTSPEPFTDASGICWDDGELNFQISDSSTFDA